MSRTPLASVATALITLGAVAGIVAFGALVDVRAATLLLAGLAFLGAAARLALPAGRSFSVRRRAVDVTVMLALAALLTFLGLTTALD